MDDETMIQRAKRAHMTSSRRANEVYMQPGAGDCFVQQIKGTWHVVLANGGGNILKVYRVDGNPIGEYRLVGLDHVPDGVEAH